jgi:hypothetical protein
MAFSGGRANVTQCSAVDRYGNLQYCDPLADIAEPNEVHMYRFPDRRVQGLTDDDRFLLAKRCRPAVAAALDSAMMPMACLREQGGASGKGTGA